MITINLTKAKEIAHGYRREARAKEFTPLDIQATIPAQAVNAETLRQEVRVRYARLQNSIDAAQDVATLKNIVNIFFVTLYGVEV